MDTEHRFNPGDRVRFKDGLWKVEVYHGNEIYTVRRTDANPWMPTEFAYERELELDDFAPLLRQSIAQAKAKKGDA